MTTDAPDRHQRPTVEVPGVMDMCAYHFWKGMAKGLKRCKDGGLDTIEAEMALRAAFNQMVFYLENCEERQEDLGL